MATAETKVTVPIATDATMQEINTTLGKIATAIEGITISNLAGQTVTLETFRRYVKAGTASKYFDIGSRFTVPWTDSVANKTYDIPFIIAHYQDVELQDGSVVPGAILQTEYLMPRNIQFDQTNAFYYAKEELPAGTYYITFGNTWGTKGTVVAGEFVSFTLTQAVPAGGQISGMRYAPDRDKSTWTIRTWTSPSATEYIEEVTPTFEATGTSLGTLEYTGNDDLWSLYCVAYGYNRWSTSAMRQWLNSDAAIGEWWTPGNNYARTPDQLTTLPGFMSGFESDFLNLLTPIKVKTYLNTIIPADKAEDYEETFDTFFLPSLEAIHCTPYDSASAGEDSIWPWWKKKSLSDTPLATYGTWPQLCMRDLSAQTTTRNMRLRSARRGYSPNVFYVSPVGLVYNTSATSAMYPAPACVIC